MHKHKEKDPLYNFQHQLSFSPVYQNLLPYPLTGEQRWVIRKGHGFPSRCLKEGCYPYVVLPDAEIRFSQNPHPPGIMHHPELVGGRDVIGAGIFRFNKGMVWYISNESGHYSPDADSLYFVKLTFQFWKIPLSQNVQLDSRWAHFRRG